MLFPGPAKKVTIYLNEDTSATEDFLYREILTLLQKRGVSGASLIRPQAGFGFHRKLHEVDDDSLGSHHLPVQIEFVETKEVVDALLPALCDMVTDGLIEAHDTVVLKSVVRAEPQ
jgi:PII-like signaling protein